MQGLLDEEQLEGAHEARITYRPRRIGVPVFDGPTSVLIDSIEYSCQLWGGAGFPLIPLTNLLTVKPEYIAMLPGSAIDAISGFHPFDLFDLEGATAQLQSQEERTFGIQLAVALLEHKKPGRYKTLEVVDLPPGDPWRGIYAACLGTLPDKPTPAVLATGNLRPELTFEDFVRVNRVTVSGSLNDLLNRLGDDEKMTPRELSMVHLAYGNSGSTGIRSTERILPDRRFKMHDAGPNVVVVCADDSVDDLALLWNLRAAHGDSRAVPIGLRLDDLSSAAIKTIADGGQISMNGFAAKSLYVTSASVSPEEIAQRIDLQDDSSVAVASISEMLTFGVAAGWVRDEVLNWTGGQSRFVALHQDDHREVFETRAISRMATMHYDLQVPDSPFPIGNDIRVHVPNGVVQYGGQSNWSTPPHRSDVHEVRWPSRLLMARAVGARMNLEFVESEPGRASRLALEGLGELGWVSNLAHAPLLGLLESMATRQGFGWYKQRLRDRGDDPDPIAAVGPTTDELPERSFSDFKRALGNNERATKYWLLWAEKSKLILKGFQLQCESCQAKQWVPIAGFAPPIVCRGCADEMTTPFRDRPNIDFKYRLSERLRRLYEQDAMGHLLVANYFDALLGSRVTGSLVGLHPGMEVRERDGTTVVGEIDVLLLTKAGELIPIEVKRSATGLVESEIEKLAALAESLKSPWTGLAVCE